MPLGSWPGIWWKRLLADGTVVIGLDRRDPRRDRMAGENLAAVIGEPLFTFIPGDLVACPVESVLLDADAVFHLAGVPGVRPSWGERLPETAPTRPLSPYGVSKLAAEALALAHTERSDSRTSVAALRYFTAYGPRQRPDMLISRVLIAALGGPPLRLYGTGEQTRDFTFVTDIVEATLAAAMTTVSGVFNVGTGHGSSVRDILRIAEDLTGVRIPVTPSVARDGDVPATQADHTLACDVLGGSRGWIWLPGCGGTSTGWASGTRPRPKPPPPDYPRPGKEIPCQC